MTNPKCPLCSSPTGTVKNKIGTFIECSKCAYSRRLKPSEELPPPPPPAKQLGTFPPPPQEKAATDKVGTGLVLIPFYSLLRLGGIFVEGLRYGRDNWKKGVNDKEYQEERLEHAILHLIKWKEGDRTEDHLAKVSWFCFTQMELERLEKNDQ